MSILTIDLGFLGIIEDEDFLLDFNFYISYIFRRFVVLSSTLNFLSVCYISDPHHVEIIVATWFAINFKTSWQI